MNPMPSQQSSPTPDSKQDSKQQDQTRPPRSPAEWVSFSLASAILAVIMGLVIYLWQDQQYQQPPEIAVVRDEPIRQAAGQFYVPFKVSNQGGETAESVQVLGELWLNGTLVESGEQQIDFLSGGETSSGAFIFTRNPKVGQLILRVASYKLP